MNKFDLDAEAERDARIAIEAHKFTMAAFDQIFGLSTITPPKAVEAMGDEEDGHDRTR